MLAHIVILKYESTLQYSSIDFTCYGGGISDWRLTQFWSETPPCSTIQLSYSSCNLSITSEEEGLLVFIKLMVCIIESQLVGDPPLPPLNIHPTFSNHWTKWVFALQLKFVQRNSMQSWNSEINLALISALGTTREELGQQKWTAAMTWKVENWTIDRRNTIETQNGQFLTILEIQWSPKMAKNSIFEAEFPASQ